MEALLLRLLNFLTIVLSRWQRPPKLDLTDWPIGVQAGIGPTREHATPLVITSKEISKHLYLIGGTGGGKTSLLQLIVRALIHNGGGFCLCDPHGDLTRAILAFVLQFQKNPKTRSCIDLDRLYLIEPFRDDLSVGLNILDPGKFSIHTHTSGVIAIFRRIWEDAWGNRTADIFRHALLTLAMSGLALTELSRLLLDAPFRKRVVAQITDPEVREYWTLRYDRVPQRTLITWLESPLNKLAELLALPGVRAMLGQTTDCLDTRQLMDSGGVLLVNASKGLLRDASHLVGSLIVAQIQAAAMSRADQPERERRRFVLILDEFQHFAGEDLEIILSEARKYGLVLVIAHQYLGQIDSTLQKAVAANVGTQIAFAASPQDAAVIAKQCADSLSVHQLIGQPVAHAMLFRRQHSPTPIQVLPVVPPEVEEAEIDAFAAELRQRHGKPLATVRAEMQARVERFARGSSDTPRRRGRQTPAAKPTESGAPLSEPASSPDVLLTIKEANDD